uniref:1,2-dehydroreticuline synthase n=1 Tax=Papaver rhoeas TaxID=33128 RepID=A0A0H4IQE2_PAPRH|nr:1,2-dehydroreticuline synthase [Papaver rhoeas]AKO60182.1 1,2-dehydroreticuline synthase [Papaver rhoeas]
MEYSDLQLFGFQPTSVVALLLALVSILLGVIAVSHHRAKPSCALPMIGLYHVFMNKTGLIHVTLGNMADKYGPIFSFPTGGHRALVVSSWEMAKECFTGDNDIVFSNRPMPLSFKIIFNAGGIDSAGLTQVPYGKYWRELRKICVHNLLSNQQLLKFRHLINSQVDTSFTKLYESCNKGNSGMVRMDDWLGELSFNVIGRIVCGFRSDTETSATSSAERFTVAIDEASRFMSIPAVSDTFPWLGWIDRLTGLIKDMKHHAEKLDLVVESIIEDHRQKRRFSRTKKGDENNTEDEQDDFIDICLSIMEQPELPGNNYARQMPIKSIIVDMIGGATDTTKLTTIWTLSLLLNNPHVLGKAKEEVDAHFGKKRSSTNGEVMVDFDDIRSLVYIQAIIKESMRLYPASPVVERLSSEDCVVGGFHVSAGTRLWVNVWKVQRDPEVWDDPSVFRPERFLSNEQKMVDVRGQDYELLPFGAGRRICPGVSFSLDLMHLVLTRLILEFEIKSPGGEVDMTATQGLMSYKVVPLDILLTRRML